MNIVQVSKVLKVQTYYKTLVNHQSRCSNSRQEEAQVCSEMEQNEIEYETKTKCSVR